MRDTLRQHRIKIALAVLLGLLAAAGILLWLAQYNMSQVMLMKDAFLAFLQDTNPLVLLAAIAFLPLVGFPVSPLLVIFGLALGKEWGLFLGMLGIALNDSIGYCIAAFFREPVKRWLEARNIKVPEIAVRDRVKIVILLRVTPGLPQAFQNYILGLAGVPFFTFLWASMIPQSVIVAGFVLTGGAIFEGKIGLILLGISLIIVFSIAGRIIQKQRKKRNATA